MSRGMRVSTAAWVALAWAGLSTANPIHGQEVETPSPDPAEALNLGQLKTMSLEEIMQIQIPTVYGASRHEQKISEAPSSVTIVTREDIQAYGHRTLADILSSVRDFYITDDQNYNYIGVRGFNRPGDFGGRILLLVDGHRMNDPAYGSAASGYDFPVDVDMISRVEVIRGPGSSLYGTNALFAVINVITRKAEEINGAEASAEAGSFDTFKGRLSYGKVLDSGLSITLTGTIYDSAGGDFYYREYDQPENFHGRAEGLDGERAYYAGATVTFGDFTMQSLYGWRRKNVPTAAFDSVFGDPGFHTIDERFFTRLAYTHEFDDGWTLRAEVYYDTYDYEGDYPAIYDPERPREATLYREEAKARWWGAEVQASRTIFEHHLVTLGAEFRDNATVEFSAVDEDPFFRYPTLSTSRGTLGFYAQDEWRIDRRLTLTAGVRYDWFEQFGDTTNPRAAVIFQPTETTILKLLYGQAYRVPNAYEAIYNLPGFRVNPGLQPEEIQSFELVVEQTLSRSWNAGASVFHNRIQDLISETHDPSDDVIFFKNGDTAETWGGSVELEARLAGGVRGRASYTLQQTEDSRTGRQLSNSPEHLAKLNLLVPVFGERLMGGLELQYISSVENTRGVSNGGAALVNLTLLSREIVKGLEASVSVYNLFDEDYSHPGGPEHRQDWLPQEGRSFRAKLTYRF